MLGLLQWYRVLLTAYLACNLTISAIAFCIAAAYSVIDRVGGPRLVILR